MEFSSASHFISTNQVVLLCSKTLRLQDPRLIDHGERVAFIASRLCRKLFAPEDVDMKSLIILSLFHDVGAYKTEEIGRMTQFESTNVHAHSVYSYLFMKHFSPLGDLSEVLKYHHVSNAVYAEHPFKYKNYSNLIHLADRLDMLMVGGADVQECCSRLDCDSFDPSMVSEAQRQLRSGELFADLRSGLFYRELLDEISGLNISFEEAVSYLRMLVYTIDFKSTYTVDHSLNTSEISLALGEKSGLSQDELEKLYFAGLIHDIGKIAIPTDILENPGRLSPAQMIIMESHVVHTEEILTGIISGEVLQIAVRHHEKLDGSGYPRGLTAQELEKSDRIIAVADVFSALVSKRSYKDSFSKGKTIQILCDMAERGQLDLAVVETAVNFFDEIAELIHVKSQPLRETYIQIVSESEIALEQLKQLCP